MMIKKIIVVGGIAVLAAMLYTYFFDQAFDKVDYNTEIKPAKQKI